MRTLLIAAAAAGMLLTAPAFANQAGTASADIQAAQTQAVPDTAVNQDMSARHRHYRHWRHHRHYGWYRGRHYGWYRHHRHHRHYWR